MMRERETDAAPMASAMSRPAAAPEKIYRGMRR